MIVGRDKSFDRRSYIEQRELSISLHIHHSHREQVNIGLGREVHHIQAESGRSGRLGASGQDTVAGYNAKRSAIHQQIVVVLGASCDRTGREAQLCAI